MNLNVVLTESETLHFLFLENVSFHVDDENGRLEALKWENYKEKMHTTLQRRCVSTQTSLEIKVDKCVMKHALLTKSKMISCSPKDIYYGTKLPGGGEALKEIIHQSHLDKSQNLDDYYFGSSESSECQGIPIHSLSKGLRRIEVVLSCKQKIYSYRLFARPLDFHEKHTRMTDRYEEEYSVTNLQKLFQLSCNKTKRTNINCFSLHKSSKWLLFVGMGDIDFEDISKGSINCWNIKNSFHPDFRIMTRKAVTALACSNHAPEILSAALLDGSILVFNFVSTEYSTIFDTHSYSGSHFSPVWKLGWRLPRLQTLKYQAECKNNMSETSKWTSLKSKPVSKTPVVFSLVSISEDGTLKLWNFSKESGLISSSILLEIYIPFNKKNFSINSNSRCKNSMLGNHFGNFPNKSCATCFAFVPNQENKFIVGTHAGDLFLWNTMKKESFAKKYVGHTMRVTTINWQPVLEVSTEVVCFLSSSLDGTINVWTIERSIPLRTLSSSKVDLGGYLEGSWCPWMKNMLIGVHSSGIHIWKLSSVTSSPNFIFNHRGITSAKFSGHSRILIVTDEAGFVTFYKISGINEGRVMFLKLTKTVRKLGAL